MTLDAWDIGPVTNADTPSLGSSNTTTLLFADSGRYVLRVYPTDVDVARIHAEHELLARLGEFPLPFAIPAPIPTRKGPLLSSTSKGWSSLTRLLHGAPPSEMDASFLHKFGRSIAALDNALGAVTDHLDAPPVTWTGDLRTVHPEIADPVAIADQIPDAALAGVDRSWLHDWLVEVDRMARPTYAGNTTILAHGDVSMANVIVDDGEIVGLIDFEFAGHDLLCADLVDGLVASVVDWSSTREWDRAAAFCAGYAQLRLLPAADLALAPTRLRYRSAATLVWWFGRWRAGAVGLDKVAVRVADAYWLDRWLTGNTSVILDRLAMCAA